MKHCAFLEGMAVFPLAKNPLPLSLVARGKSAQAVRDLLIASSIVVGDIGMKFFVRDVPMMGIAVWLPAKPLLAVQVAVDPRKRVLDIDRARWPPAITFRI